jgi:hypothetical protein
MDELQASNTTLVSYQYGVRLSSGEVVEFPHPDSAVAKAGAQSMVKAIANGAYKGEGRAVLVARKVETKVASWVVV